MRVPNPGTMLSTAIGMARKRGITGNAFLKTPGFSSTSRISPPNSAASREVYTFPVSALDILSVISARRRDDEFPLERDFALIGVAALRKCAEI